MNLVQERSLTPRRILSRQKSSAGDPGSPWQQKSMQDQVKREVFAFAEYDLDGNEKLDFEEFFAMLPRYIREHHTVDAIKVWFHAADKDNSGDISINEFVSRRRHFNSFGRRTRVPPHSRRSVSYLDAAVTMRAFEFVRPFAVQVEPEQRLSALRRAVSQPHLPRV